MQPVNNLFEAIIINNHRTHGFFSLGKKWKQSPILELLLEDSSKMRPDVVYILEYLKFIWLK